MALRFTYLASVLAVGAAAAAIGLAPIASAADTTATAPQSSCTDLSGTETECQSPGNVQINDSPPVEFTPQYPYWEGGYFEGGHYGGGGFHSGGGHR
jgi:hypothetical protein